MSEKSLHYLTYLPMYLAYANTVANPFVYGWMNRALRRELVLNEVVLNRFFTKTKVEVSSSDDNNQPLDENNKGVNKDIQQVMKQPGNNRILGENIVQSPIDDRKRYNSK